MRQTMINEACKKELQERACREIALWMYNAVVLFNVVNYPSFEVMIEATWQYGVAMKPPSSHEVRVLLLKKEVDNIATLMKSYEKE
ncbi:hypothetical protein DITRI_Ditri16bG0104200 [Diplodiscus trichospermus]